MTYILSPERDLDPTGAFRRYAEYLQQAKVAFLPEPYLSQRLTGTSERPIIVRRTTAGFAERHLKKAKEGRDENSEASRYVWFFLARTKTLSSSSTIRKCSHTHSRAM